MEALIIGALEGALTVAGISVFDRLKIKKYQRKIEEGTATTVECGKVIAMLMKDKDSFAKVKACCDKLIQKDKQLTFANTILGVAYLQEPIGLSKMSNEQILISEGFSNAKKSFDRAYLAKADSSRIEYKDMEDIRVLAQVNGMLNYHYGFILKVEGDDEKSLHYKELGLKQVEHTKGFIHY